MKLSLSSIAILLITAADASHGETNTYVEDFTTTTFKDVALTQTDWNTADGELKLFPFPVTLAGSYDTPDNAFVLHVSGDHAYIVDGAGGGLQVIDISDPTNPTLAGSYNTPGLARGVFVVGDHAYVADGAAGLQVIDISDPTTPTLAGTYNTADFAYEVFVSGSNAYVADNLSGLLVINISNPAAPVLVGSYDTPDFAYAVFVDGDHAFVADDNSGLHIINISNPALPTLAGSFDTPGRARGIVVSGDHAYLADGPSGLQVFDVSDPTAPTLAGSYDTPDFARGLTVVGDRAYVADASSGLQWIDISDPSLPTLADSYDTPGTAGDVVVAGTLAFVADGGSGLQIISISASMSPRPRTGFDTGNATGIFLAGDHAFVADGASGLLILDVSDPIAPTVAGSFDTAGAANGVHVAGNYAYVAGGTSGLQVIDVSDPTAPFIVATRNTPGTAANVHVAGNYAYVADLGIGAGNEGLAIYSIADPTAPLLRGTFFSPEVRSVHVVGNYAYIADGSAGLRVIDVSNKSNPVQVGTYNTPGTAYDVSVLGDHAYVADGTENLLVIDISNPLVPFLAGAEGLLGFSYDVFVDGDWAYVVSGTGLMYRVNISNPLNPTSLGSYQPSGDARRVFVEGELAFLATGTPGLEVVQVYQSEVDEDNNETFSLNIDSSTDAILRARLTTNHTGDIFAYLSNSGGSGYAPYTSFNTWHDFSSSGSGSDLRWALFLGYQPGSNPVVSQLTMEWLNDYASIAAVVDIPNDQGRQVSVEWMRSGHDFAGDASQITEYAVYRKIDPGLKAAVGGVETQDLTAHSAAVQQHAQLMKSSGWHFISTAPVRLEDHYAVVCPTLADSTVTVGQFWTSFRVSALTATPGVFFDSPPDSGYSVDNLAPSVPANLLATVTGDVELSWIDVENEDLQFYTIYRDQVSGFIPDSGNRLGFSAGAALTDDTVQPGQAYYYAVTATDFGGNESGTSNEVEAVIAPTGIPFLPERFALRQNHPNPFNPVTRIGFDLAGDSEVLLQVFDLRGRLVRTLIDEPMLGGVQEIDWNGRDDHGVSLSSGSYVLRLEAGDFREIRKMTLLK